MGVDVVFKVKPSWVMSPDEFETIRERFHEKYPDDFGGRETYRYPDLKWSEDEGELNTVEVGSLDRYYGVDYERGNWPHIREMGEWISEHIPGELRYGGDSAWEWEFLRPWPQERDRLDKHWAEHGNEPYRRSWA